MCYQIKYTTTGREMSVSFLQSWVAQSEHVTAIFISRTVFFYNSLWVDMSLHSDTYTFSWFRANQSLLLLLNGSNEATNVKWFAPTGVKSHVVLEVSMLAITLPIYVMLDILDKCIQFEG
jgi:hypothetical protein